MKHFSIFILLLLIVSCKENQTQLKSSENIQSNFAHEKLQDSLAFKLCEMYGLDQGIRDTSLKYNKRIVMPKIDTISFNKLVSFIKNHGYPTKHLLGEKNWAHQCVGSSATAIMLHNPHRLVNEEEYFNLFLEEVEKGNMSRDFLANVLDKYYWAQSRGERVMYGSHFGQPCIETKEDTNKLRQKIGLHPLNDDEFKICE